MLNGGVVNNLIEFTIDNVTYYSEEGMTFVEWVNSEYNTGGYVGLSQSIISGAIYSMALCPV